MSSNADFHGLSLLFYGLVVLLGHRQHLTPTGTDSSAQHEPEESGI